MSYNAREQETTSFAKIRIAFFQANYWNRTLGMFMKGKYNLVVDHLSLTKPRKVENKKKSVWICYFVRDYLPHRKLTFTSAVTFALLKSYSLFLSSYEDIKIKLCTFRKWNEIIIQLVKWMSRIVQGCYLFFLFCNVLFCICQILTLLEAFPVCVCLCTYRKHHVFFSFTCRLTIFFCVCVRVGNNA